MGIEKRVTPKGKKSAKKKADAAAAALPPSDKEKAPEAEASAEDKPETSPESAQAPVPAAIARSEPDDEREERAAALSEIENYIETYQTSAEWIRFADAKAAVVLAANGALASVLIPTLKPFIDERLAVAEDKIGPYAYLTLACFFCWLLAALLSSVRAFLCIHPMASKKSGFDPNRYSHFHPAAINAKYKLSETDKFCDDFEKMGPHGFRKEVLSCLLFDSYVSTWKYRNVVASIRWMGIMAFLGFSYLVLAQF